MGEKGEALLFLQPVEIDYLHDLQKHGVSLKDYPLQKVLDSFPLPGQKHSNRKLISLEMHPWVLLLQKAVESFISSEVLHFLFFPSLCSCLFIYRNLQVILSLQISSVQFVLFICILES